LYAFIEGLCGIEDLNHSFQEVRCAPRWIASDEEKAHVYVSYANSGASFGYQFLHLPKKSIIQINLEATNAQVELHLLLPQNSSVKVVIWNRAQAPFQMEIIQNSPYVNSKGAVVGKAKVEIIYGKV
ncbi:MAG: hypothetical protein ACE5HI_17675, partial [bacterium]